MSEEKSIILDLQELILDDKQNFLNKALWEKRFIDFVNSKTYQELGENEIKDRTLCVLEINKFIVKNACRKSTEKKLTEIKKVVDKFNTMFDKRTSAGLPSC